MITVYRKGIGLVSTPLEWNNYQYQVWNWGTHYTIKTPKQTITKPMPPDHIIPINDTTQYQTTPSENIINLSNTNKPDLSQYKQLAPLIYAYALTFAFSSITNIPTPKLAIIGEKYTRHTLIANILKLYNITEENQTTPYNSLPNESDFIQYNSFEFKPDTNTIYIHIPDIIHTPIQPTNILIDTITQRCAHITPNWTHYPTRLSAVLKSNNHRLSSAPLGIVNEYAQTGCPPIRLLSAFVPLALVLRYLLSNNVVSVSYCIGTVSG